MGLLTLLEPHFREVRQELIKLQNAAKNLTDTSKPTIFCEGLTDKIIFDEVLRLFFPAHAKQVAVRCSTYQGGGHAWVGEMLIGWSYSRPLAKAVGVFDKDGDAQLTMKQSVEKLNGPPSGKKAYGVALIPGLQLKACFTRKVPVPFAVEELLHENIWDHAEKEGWLEDRPNPIELYKFARRDITFDDYVKTLLPEEHLHRLALMKIVLKKKEALAKYVCSLADEAEKKRALDGVKPTMEECLKKLGLL
ncbi:MAG: hypothetical protein HY273_16715 [Gammaproteobacteria bacterium]|nr:hypothetical protein [Gammaproteobacteria bacterium]